MTLSIHFGPVVKQVREQQGWTQEVLADQASLNRSYIGEVERGTAVPSISTVAKLAKALGVSASDLLARCEARANSEAAACGELIVKDGYSRLSAP